MALATPNCKAQTQEVSVEFETLHWLKDINQGNETITPGPFFFSNQNDDPHAWPIIEINEVNQHNNKSTDNQKNFIEIQSLKGITNKPASSQTFLNRWVEIPQPPPNKIEISFKTRVTNNNDQKVTSPSSPAVSGFIGLVGNKNSKATVLTIKEEDLISEKDPVGSWVQHSKLLTIPKLAKFIHFSFMTSQGFNLALSDWRLKAYNENQDSNSNTTPIKKKSQKPN